jgi:hypothetical protein
MLNEGKDPDLTVPLPRSPPRADLPHSQRRGRYPAKLEKHGGGGGGSSPRLWPDSTWRKPLGPATAR